VKHLIKEYRKIIPPILCEKIIKYFDQDNLSHAQISLPSGKIDTNKKVRNCEITSIEPPKKLGEKLMVNYIKSRIHLMTEDYIKPYKNFFVPTEIESIQFLKYAANEHEAGYNFHTDHGKNTSKRSLSISICLNNNFIGGEFLFDVEGEILKFPQNTGDAIIFPSNFLFPHQVNKIKSGTRYALVTWVL
tara:strand:- start:2354 stop:2920 length:567 start_codon:yes stop_codon:yes gene_type:complete